MFSNSALEMLSSSGLPYDDYTKGFILQHLLDLVLDFIPQLQLKIVPVTDSYNLLQANGKICYGDRNRYNIPVIIYFLESYPRRPPNVWVNCPDDTIIRECDQCVASSGEVTHPYLRDWCQSSNLVYLVMQLSDAFSRKEPFAVPNFDGRLSLEKTKLAKILIDNGLNALLWAFNGDPNPLIDQITCRYPRHPDLASHIKTKDGGVEAFIKIAKDTARKKFGIQLPGTHGCRQADQMSSLHSIHDLPQQEIPPAVNIRISNLLSRQGLLYDDSTKESIRQHLFDLLRDYPWLEGHVNDNLINVDGVIPYSVHGKIYSVPVIIWLHESYPVGRPRVWVDSPNNHVIMQNLVYVAPSGMVCLPYLQNWDRFKSNLVGLISHLSAEFTCQPPFTTRPRYGMSSLSPEFCILYVFVYA
ncbi:unnamed protein product [Arabidopsis arenosa]|uniref:UEV domain-containing protein n=1 Tax=Arabidopsis arenosa TaxID=38785 RepID=A0A8S2A1T8_ARAAE|nr:unnamed protein product [Arabidopsis arenosa]